MGFEALATTSAGLAFSLGRSDGAAGREETLANAKAIVQATHLPVAADLENGFGQAPEKAAETIRLANPAASPAVRLRMRAATAHKPIYDFNLAVERIAAVVEAVCAQDIPFMLAARAENFLHGRPDLDDTIKRLQAFEKAGADVLYAPGLPSLKAIKEVCSAVTRPVNVLAGAAFTLKQLEDAGVKRVSVGSALNLSALAAFAKSAHEMKDFGTFNFAKDAFPFGEINKLMKEEPR